MISTDTPPPPPDPALAISIRSSIHANTHPSTHSFRNACTVHELHSLLLNSSLQFKFVLVILCSSNQLIVPISTPQSQNLKIVRPDELKQEMNCKINNNYKETVYLRRSVNKSTIRSLTEAKQYNEGTLPGHNGRIQVEISLILLQMAGTRVLCLLQNQMKTSAGT